MILPMIEYNLYLVLIQNVFNNSKMKDDKIKDLQSATFERLLKHLDERKDVQNIEEAEKKGITISDPDAREHIYGMPYSEWKEKFQK